jgi:hypothetical protein
MRTEPAQSHDRADSRVRFASLTPIAPKQSEGRARPGAPEYQMPSLAKANAVPRGVYFARDNSTMPRMEIDFDCKKCRDFIRTSS